MLLEGKSAVVYGASGAIGGAVAKAFAAEGASVTLVGQEIERLEPVQEEIARSGGWAETAAFDARDAQTVEEHLTRLVGERGRLDISFNAVGNGYVIGKPLTEATADDFLKSMGLAMQTQFATSTAAGRVMAQAGSGVILTITATPARAGLPNMGSLGVVGAATEAFCRQLAVDLGPSGVRVVCLRSAGSPESPGVDYALTAGAERLGISRDAFEEQVAQRAALRRLPRLAEIAGVAALMASDRASAVTGAVANISCGEILD